MITVCHEFVSLDAELVACGKPGRQQRKSANLTSGCLIENWHLSIRNVSVSSKQIQAFHLVDGNTGYWQSAGAQGKVRTRINCCLETFLAI